MSWLRPDWPAPENVKAFSTTRYGGVSAAPYDSLNLGLHVHDQASTVQQNRLIVKEALSLPNEPIWLDQVHSAAVVDADRLQGHMTCKADSSVSHQKKVICTVMTADCLPVLFCDRQGTAVAAAHAGWRGLCNGILEATIRNMHCQPDQLIAWMGPAIGPTAFEVGPEVKDAFTEKHPTAKAAFQPSTNMGKWMADIYELANIRLAAAGLTSVYGGGLCTYQDADRFFSYRRDGVTGRMASLIWLE